MLCVNGKDFLNEVISPTSLNAKVILPDNSAAVVHFRNLQYSGYCCLYSPPLIRAYTGTSRLTRSAIVFLFGHYDW